MHDRLRPRILRPDGLRRSIGLAVGVATLAASLMGPASAQPAPQAATGEIIVYLLDHQYLADDELGTIKSEIETIFREAGLSMDWVADDSPRRKLAANELRVIILPSDGTRWFHGPSNVIGIAPHDDQGFGRNCFVFYRQAIWFRQQAALRCQETIRARTEAAMRGVEVPEEITRQAPADCGDRLPSLTAMIVARAAAHEMVHILLDKIDHSEEGLMRDSFDIAELWHIDERSAFRLGAADIAALQQLHGADAGSR